MWLIVLLGILIVVAFPLVAYFILAPRNLWFTFVKEGTAKIVVRGDKFEKALIQWEEHTLNGKTWDVIKGKEPWHPLGGFRYYGFWPIKDIYIYRFQWTGVTVDGKVEVHPEEWLDYVLLKEDVYWCKLEMAEDKNLLPLDLELLITMRVVNPYKALFRVQNWNEMIMNRTKPLFRQFVANTTFDDLIARKQEAGGEIYKTLVKTGLLGQFKKDYGVEIKDGGIEIKEVNPAEIPGVPSLRSVTLKKQIAERDRDRILVEADAEKSRLITVAEGEKERIKTVYSQIKEFGDLGKLVRVLEAVEKSPLAASLTVQAVPGLQEVLRGVFGKPPETISSQEFQELKEMVEKMNKEKGG